MGETPTPINKPAQTVDDIIAFAQFKVMIPVGIAVLSTYFPFFGWPVVKNVVEYILDQITMPLYVALSRFFVFSVIDIMTNEELTHYESAEEKLRAIHQTGDPIEIQKASDEFDKALGSLIHWDGSIVFAH